jgi:acyl transferase domain-containing protein
LTADVAMFRLLGTQGVKPAMVAGHSLGEYAACVAGGVMSFADALYAVSARGREMAGVKVKDNGKMASVAAGAEKVEPVLREIDGYVIAANKNCFSQTVIAGETVAVEKAIKRFTEIGIEAREIPVSHAFHSAIVAPASKPLRRVLDNLTITAPTTPVTCNVDASYYPKDKAQIVDLLARQLESPVEFIAQIERMFADGARVFVEVGPRRAVTGFVRNVLDVREGVAYQAIATNHHKKPAIDTLMEALAAMACEGMLAGAPTTETTTPRAEVRAPTTENREPKTDGRPATRVVVSGVSAVLPSERPIESVDGDIFARMLSGENFIHRIDENGRRGMLSKNVTRLDKAGGEFATMRELTEVIQLAASIGELDVVRDYGVDAAFDDALDRTSRLAIAAGVDALRDAGLPRATPRAL